MKQSPRSKRLCGSARMGSQTHVYRCGGNELYDALRLVNCHAAEGRLTLWAAGWIQGQLIAQNFIGRAASDE